MMGCHFRPITRDAKGRIPPVTLANGERAYTRNRRVTQSMIDRYGSRADALKAMENEQ